MRERLARAACYYGRAWRTHFAQPQDPCALLGEQNQLIYTPCRALVIRAAIGASQEHVLSSCLAAVSVGACPTLSLAPGLGWTLPKLPGCGEVLDEPDHALCARVAKGSIERIRIFGRVDAELRRTASLHGTYLAAEPPLAAGRIELLNYLREQARSYAYHRYGSLHEARLAELTGKALTHRR
jgi:RHH-type proline utilization regulon transcriptional repressor/proline dehydrogenase/delta 1-pyrroline-5-carboxylate dehydrogenase